MSDEPTEFGDTDDDDAVDESDDTETEKDDEPA